MNAPGNSSNGRLVIISGPSGVGKSTCVKRLFEICDLPLEMSVSATTRPMRPGEVDGKDYRFVTKDEFLKMEAAGDFLETAEVFGVGHHYGTLREPVATSLAQGKWIILEIDVIGAGKVMNSIPDVTSVFIFQTIEEIESRLRGRKTESEEAIQRRLEVANSELELKNTYQHQVINEDIDNTANTICQILKQSCNCESQSKAEN